MVVKPKIGKKNINNKIMAKKAKNCSFTIMYSGSILTTPGGRNWSIPTQKVEERDPRDRGRA